jgi:subtilisin family serine protease
MLNGTYQFNDGNSFASPFVTGLAALIWSYDLQLTNKEVQQVIENSCKNINDSNQDYQNKLGNELINALSALSLVKKYG